MHSNRVSLTPCLAAVIAAANLAAAPMVRAQSACATGLPNGYRVDASWPQLPEGRHFGAVSGVFVDAKGFIWIADRCGGASCAKSDLDPIFKFDANGKLLANFGAGLFVQPHSLTVDRQGNVWVADSQMDGDKGQQVLKLSGDGKVLMALGRAGVATEALDGFNQPTSIAIAQNGNVFVAEGHGPSNGNSRIMEFSAQGRFIRTWGSKGSLPDQFMGPHGLAFDSKGRLFVADRGNSRVEIYSQEGKLLDTWTQFGAPGGIYIDRHDVLYVADATSTEKLNPGCRRGIWIASARSGKTLRFIPDPGPPPPPDAGTSAAEGVAADSSGAIYGAEVLAHDVKKYIKDTP